MTKLGDQFDFCISILFALRSSSWSVGEVLNGETVRVSEKLGFQWEKKWLC